MRTSHPKTVIHPCFWNEDDMQMECGWQACVPKRTSAVAAPCVFGWHSECLMDEWLHYLQWNLHLQIVSGEGKAACFLSWIICLMTIWNETTDELEVVRNILGRSMCHVYWWKFIADDFSMKIHCTWSFCDLRCKCEKLKNKTKQKKQTKKKKKKNNDVGAEWIQCNCWSIGPI